MEAIMKQRMITVVYGIALLLIILLLYKTVVFNTAIAAVTVIAVYEIFSATKNLRNKGLTAVCFIFAAALPFLNYLKLKDAAVIAYFAFMLALFSIMLKKHKTLRLEQMSLCFMMTLLVTASMSCFIFLRDEYLFSGRLKDLALFYIALVFITAWITDVGGYVFGRLFGRHKMSPSVSPRKTVEGAVGGVLLTVLISVLALWGYSAYLSANGVQANYNYGSLIILSILCALISIIGDLSASLIKRENNIKDFGNILPGHGGILDRFDSIIFVAPLILVWVRLFPILSL
jgi:phosphatidate cytidylyltransferase